jgi:hypothetical protein
VAQHGGRSGGSVRMARSSRRARDREKASRARRRAADELFPRLPRGGGLGVGGEGIGDKGM